MKLSKKCQYALKAIFELAWRNNGKPVKTRDIAGSQRMSLRFTEIILNELKHGGFVESRRGSDGGYRLARKADAISIKEVVEYVEGPISVAPDAMDDLAFKGNAAFKDLWQHIDGAVAAVCDGNSFADLVEFERAQKQDSAPNYSI